MEGRVPSRPAAADQYTAAVLCLAARGMWSASVLVEMELDLPKLLPALGTMPVPNAYPTLSSA